MTDFFSVKISKEEINAMSSLALAHVGDAVYELMVRVSLYRVGGHTAGEMHKKAVSFVSATAQAEAMEKIKPMLTEEEIGVFKRGRNTRVNSVPHNATIAQYHSATGLEALFGYLYLIGDRERINEFFDVIMREN